jgi:hypothetical protein
MLLPVSALMAVIEPVLPTANTRPTGDKYAPGFVSEGFRTHAITYKQAEHDRSSLYLGLVPLVNSGAVSLLDDAASLRELRGLERRRGPSGRDKVDHRINSHDDRSNAIAGAVLAASARERYTRQRAALWG